ncbi:MAG: YqgE/AlgH family protein, partial [bacterium]|nr:YqgE/AlgH family protein [bacterium]
PGQLDKEVQAGGWLTVPANAEYIFYRGDDLWEKASKEFGQSTLQSMLHIKHFPQDPSVN